MTREAVPWPSTLPLKNNRFGTNYTKPSTKVICFCFQILIRLTKLESMFTRATLPLLLLVLTLSTLASAATITFNQTEVNLGQGAGAGTYGLPTNEWASFGISISGSYLYNDARDTFDRIGLAQNAESGGVITFSTPQSILKFDYLVLAGNSARYAIFDSSNVFIDAISPFADATALNATHTFNAPDIAKLVFTGGIGVVTVSTLFLDGASNNIPEPATLGLMGFSLVILTARKFFSKR